MILKIFYIVFKQEKRKPSKFDFRDINFFQDFQKKTRKQIQNGKAKFTCK